MRPCPMRKQLPRPFAMDGDLLHLHRGGSRQLTMPLSRICCRRSRRVVAQCRPASTLRHVRSWRNLPCERLTKGRVLTLSGGRRSKVFALRHASFNNLVGGEQDAEWHLDAERARGLAVDDELESR